MVLVFGRKQRFLEDVLKLFFFPLELDLCRGKNYLLHGKSIVNPNFRVGIKASAGCGHSTRWHLLHLCNWQSLFTSCFILLTL